uniref:V-type ATP synthase subunit F n=1 Tax=Rubrobacter marinus TaxID=2653852 RepID=UPI00389A4BB6
MSRLIVLTTPDLAPGYRLAGAATVGVASPQEAEATLLELVDGEGGVIAVHEAYHARLDRELRRRFDETLSPLVVPLPEGEAHEAEGGRRERLLKMLWQAVGYEITFDAEGGAAR